MIRVALRGLAGRKLRAALTALAIVLGVAMISGTYVLTDTIDRAFKNLFTDSYVGTEVVISGAQEFETDFSQPPPFDEGLLEQVRAIDGVDAAVGAVQSFSVQLTDKQGEPITTGGAPTLGFGIDFSRPEFSPLTLTDGAWPDAAGEVALDAGTAKEEGYQVGDTIGIRALQAIEPFTITGIARFGSVDSIGGATAAYFDVPTAQALFGKDGKLDGIQISAAEGVTPQQLLERIEPILPERTKVLTAAEQAAEDSADVEEFTSFIRYFLLAFGGIALFVGGFVIFNTLSITVAQRTREFATLRTLGASRRQVLGSVIVEALVIGAFASVIGLFAGLGLAKGLNEVFVSFGIDLPKTGTVFAVRTIVISLVVGIVITLLAGVFPAIRATRVPPISAVREGASLPASRLGRFATPIALVTAGLGLALLLLGMFSSGLGTTNVLVLLGVGVLVLFIGIALVSAKLVQPLARLVGWPATRVGGAAGRLARQNATRNPQRTASTAAALMIGLALITFVAVLASGLTKSVESAIDEQVRADYVVVSENGFAPFEPGVDAGLAALEGTFVSPVRGENARAFDETAQVTGIDPATIAGVYAFDWTSGSNDVAASLAADAALVEEAYADDHGLAVGERFTVLAPNGNELELTVAGLYSAPSFWQMLGDVALPIPTFDATFEEPRNLYTFIRVGDGPSEGALAALQGVAAEYPGVELDDREGFRDSQAEGINQLLQLLYVLLALSVLISLFGMVNTLVLSVFERTRELGMLRAVGMTRRQVRRMVRHESIITALIGAALGMPLGIALAAIVTTKLAEEGLTFSVPVPTIVIFVIAAVLAGIVAAVWPARRAARLNVLNALQYE